MNAVSWAFEGLGGEVILRILDQTGNVVYPVAAGLMALASEGETFDPRRKAFAFRNGSIDMHAGTAPFYRGGRTWYVQLAASDRLVLQVRQTIGLPALWQGMLATCATFFVVFLVTTNFTLRRALLPLRAASAAARRITPRTLKDRLDASAQPVEIKPLVPTLLSSMPAG
ncbi:MAG: hypothetical protein EOP02_05275 [Proteobacteria bacterium]|nr:MAG: hypothetical protein EOP02_05275 [Pseudomonadota bacterium]